MIKAIVVIIKDDKEISTPPVVFRTVDCTLDAVLGSVQGALANGDQVSLVGFGTFSVKHRAARSGRNPQTGAEIQIKASNVPSFKAGKALKDAVN